MMKEEYVYSVSMATPRMVVTEWEEKIPNQCLQGTIRTKIAAGKGSIFVIFAVTSDGKDPADEYSAEEREREGEEDREKEKTKEQSGSGGVSEETGAEAPTEKIGCLLMAKTGNNQNTKWIELDTEFSDRIHPVYEPLLVGQADPHLGFAAASTLSDVVFIANTDQEIGGVSGSEVPWSDRVSMCDARQPKGKQCIPVVDRFAHMTNGHPDSRFLLFWNNGEESRLYNCNDGGLYVLHDALTNERRWEELINYPISEINQGAYDPDNDVWMLVAQDNGISRTNPGIYEYAQLQSTGDGTYVVPSRDEDGQVYFLSAIQYGGYPVLAWWNASEANWTVRYFEFEYDWALPFNPKTLFNLGTGSIVIGDYGEVFETFNWNKQFHSIFSEAGIIVPAQGAVIQLRQLPMSTASPKLPFHALTEDGFLLTRTPLGRLSFLDLNPTLNRLNAQALSVCVHPSNSNIFYVVTRRYILEFVGQRMTIVGDFEPFFPYPTFQQVRDCRMIYSENKDMHYMIAATSAGLFAAQATVSSNASAWEFSLISDKVTYYQQIDYDEVADHLNIASFGSGLFYIKEASAKLDCFFYGETEITELTSMSATLPSSGSILNLPNLILAGAILLLYSLF